MFRRRYNILPIIILGCVLIGITVFTIDLKLKASILEIAKSRAQITGMEIINQVINEKIVSNVEYQDIVYVHKDNEGKIVLIQPNTVKLNQIMALTIIEITEEFNQMNDNTFNIPLGQITGSKMLAGYGPKVKVRMVPASQIHVEVLNKFEQAGINQTRHLIYFNIKSDITVAVPFLNEEVHVATTLPLAETIIVGDVPKTYVNFTGSSEMLYPLIKGD